jgi:dipeptidyl aminopeptidase/acylaminoacyl peptidase
MLIRRKSRAGRAPTRPFSACDLVALHRVSDVHAASDSPRVVFTVRATDLEANKGRNDLWLVNVDGTGLRRLTSHAAGSQHPRWSPDGRWIYFLSGRADSSQVWRIAADGGEAVQVTKLPLDVGVFAVSPTGKHLVVSLEVFPGVTPEETKQRLDEVAKQKRTGKVYDRLFIRHWDTWKDGRRAHLFVVPADSENMPSEPPAQAGGSHPTLARGARTGGILADLMRGLDADCPSKPFGGAEEFTFTPDGRAVVFAARNVGRKEAWSTHFDLFLAPLAGKKKPRVIVDGRGATVTQPTFSPDGKTLAYLAMTRPGFESDRYRIVLKRWPNGRPQVLTEDWDRSPRKIVWSQDSQTIYTHADHLGHHPLFTVDVQTGRVRTLVGAGKVAEIAVAGERVVYGLCHLRSPVELRTIAADGGRARAITRINASRLASVRLGDSEQFTFTGWNDEPVYAWIVKPVDFSPRKKYPVAFLVHGGPQGSFGSDFHYRWNPQVYAGAGYAAVMIDFHGSTGYGQAFTDAISGHWGDRPLEDLQKGLAAALERYPWLDGRRVAALGASYGGYMINWIHGVWPGRFRCLVCHDGNLDERMAYFDTEELWFPEWEYGGPPWELPEAYARHNPIDHVHKWKTPTLVIHGGRDFRVADTQGLATFTALQRRGVPSKLLYFPDENHWVLKPANSIQWHETVLGWLERWCKK